MLKYPSRRYNGRTPYSPTMSLIRTWSVTVSEPDYRGDLPNFLLVFTLLHRVDILVYLRLLYKRVQDVQHAV